MSTTMLQVDFDVVRAEPVDFAAVPTIRFVLGIESDRDVRSILLDTQIAIAARRRSYDPESHDRLFALFGAPEGWGSTLRNLLWSRQTVVVPAFSGRTEVDLLVPCSYDVEVAASGYFDALEDGHVPLELTFSGSLFYAGENGMLQTERISWESEAEFRFPVAVWREVMDRHFPGAAWLRLRKGTFDRLRAYRSRTSLSWDDAVERLLDG